MIHNNTPKTRNAALSVAAAPALTFAASAADAGATACASSGNTSVAALSQDWILVSWERKAGDGPLDFRQKLGKYYDWSSLDVVLYDDFDPQHRVVRSPAAYRTIWEPGFSALNTAHHRLAMGPFVLGSGDLAVATLQWVARFESKDGKVTGIRSFTTLAWRCTGDGWTIVREHNSSVVLPPGQVDAALAAARN